MWRRCKKVLLLVLSVLFLFFVYNGFLYSTSFSPRFTQFIPALATFDIQTYLGEPQEAPVTYSKEEVTVGQTPILPFLPWAIHFSEDYVVSLKDDHGWGMIELTKMILPGHGVVWFVLDSKLDGSQYVGIPRGLRESVDLVGQFPGVLYETDITVESKDSGNDRTLHASYTRVDGEQVSFTMTVDARPKTQLFPNGNAMNHSQSDALALIDLQSFRLADSFSFEGKERELFQIGVPIVGLLDQTAGGLMVGAWQQSGMIKTPTTINGIVNGESRTLVTQEDEQYVYVFESSTIQTTEYRFKKRAADTSILELETIQVREAGKVDGNTLLQVSFNPALPDFRRDFSYDGERLESKVAISFGDTARAYGKGKVLITKDSEHEYLLQLFGKYPSWFSKRPIQSVIQKTDTGVSVVSTLLTRGADTVEKSTITAQQATRDTQLLQGFKVFWEKRPHRISDFSIHVPEVDAKTGLLGGTWANGAIAHDSVATEVAYQTLVTSDDVFTATTPRISLLPYDRVTENQTIVSGEQSITIKFPKDTFSAKDMPHVFINGFDFTAGPQHIHTGLTPQSLAFAVSDVRVVSDHELGIKVRLSQGFGSVPDRIQDLKRYTGSGKLDLVIITGVESKEDQIFRTTFDNERGGLLREGKAEVLESVCVAEKGTIAPVYGYTGFSMDLGSHGIFPGRFLRGLRSTTDPASNKEQFSNASKLMRKTPYRVTRVLQKLPSTIILGEKGCATHEAM